MAGTVSISMAGYVTPVKLGKLLKVVQELPAQGQHPGMPTNVKDPAGPKQDQKPAASPIKGGADG